MSVVRIADRPIREIGPKSIITALPSLQAIWAPPLKKIPFATTVVTLDTAPKAGQVWEVQRLYFNFPNSFTRSVEVGVGTFFSDDWIFEIAVSFGSRTIAQQIFQTSSQKNGEKNRWPLVGNLEGFTDTSVYPGENITISAKLKLANFDEITKTVGEAGAGEAMTNPGESIFTYMQRSR